MSTSPATVLARLHSARLAPYQQRCGSTDHELLALYTWNNHLSAAFQESLATTEVILRCALDEAIRSWNLQQPAPQGVGAPTADWLEHPAAPLATIVNHRYRTELMSYATTAKAKRSAGHPRRNAPVTHDDLVSQTTFGLWKRLLPHRRGNPTNVQITQVLWTQALRTAFPNLRQDPNGYATANRVRHLHALRNRVAHMENLLDVDIEARHRDMVQLLTAVDADLYHWANASSRVMAVATLRSHP
ncbi:hypothetical protein [Mycobacteroides abscessus]|uniref:hypothetical protein n=1 Tax=Mycobacteroides abscessus TaxID=36809 RepID=UPI00092626AE|nr:hypothetical protein [Mycobacteroides abscessus]SHQ47861.1 Abi-like protein [Mycobacteroides abscessus subsp. abscessus]SKQ85860.1 Abi-like protein [Mycobacteroides abscessus subsp. massiliense]SLC48706.1 Abi-like protein [Mycobacteroides abscessus subsp. massiliense]